MRRSSFFLFLLLPLLVLNSCQKIQGESFDAFSGAFVCEYSYTDGGELYRVKLWAGDIDNDGERNVTLSFIEPDTLEGIECKLIAGEYTVSCGDVLISGVPARAFFSTAEPLLHGTRAEFCEVSELDGRRAERFKISHENGDVYVYVDGNTELPMAIVSRWKTKDIKLNIISFERKEK